MQPARAGFEDDDDEGDGEGTRSYGQPCWLGQQILGTVFAILFGIVGLLLSGALGPSALVVAQSLGELAQHGTETGGGGQDPH